MTITIEQTPYKFSANWDHLDTIEGGFLKEYYVEPAEAVDAALDLLSKIYTPQKVAAAIRQTDYFKIYYEGEDK